MDLIKLSNAKVTFLPARSLKIVRYILVFLCIYFQANLFNNDFVHVSYQGTEVCNGWIPMESIFGHLSRGKEGILMYES